MNTAEKESDDDRRISIICFSLTGKETAQKLKEGLEKCGYHTELYKKSRYLEDSIAESTADWTAEHFPQGGWTYFCRSLWDCCAQHRTCRLPVRSQTRQFWSWMSADSL